jgi:hypothetical protein
MHCIAEPDSLCFYFEVEDMSFNSEDVIVIGIHSGAGTNDYQRLHIYPFTTGSAPANGSDLSPSSIEYYDQGTYSSSTGWSFHSAAVPAGVRARVATATGAYLKWSVEVKIPVGAPFNIPASDYFGMYVDVARTDDIDHPTGPADAIVAIQWTWPPERIIGSADEDIYGYVESGTPAPTLWGNASRATTIGNGVFIMSSDISTNQDDPSKISLNQDNIFTATPHNNSANASGTLTTATDVKATFKIANFGLPSPSAWALIPTGGPGVDLATVDPNPTAGADIPPTGTVSLSAGPWHLSVAEAATYAANLHQCVKVELSYTDASTVFFNSYAYRNMDFVTTSSPFERTAQVGTRGYKLAPKKDQHEFILMETAYNTPPGLAWKSKLTGFTTQGKGSYLLRVPHEQDSRLSTTITPPAVKIRSTFVSVPPGTGGGRKAFIRIPVESDQVVTLIAEGSMQLRKSEKGPLISGPNGRDLTANDKERGTKGYLIPDQSVPQRMVGALVGTWDGFKESFFVVGQARSLKVPKGASALSLAINDHTAGYEQHGGKGFRVQVVATPLEKYFVSASSILSRDPRAEYLPIPVGANLPTWIMRGYRSTGKTIIINKTKFNALEYVGSFGYIVKSIGE